MGRHVGLVNTGYGKGMLGRRVPGPGEAVIDGAWSVGGHMGTWPTP